MSVKMIRVRAWDTTVGAIAPNPRLGVYAFQYSQEWVRSGIEIAPVTMPLRNGAAHVWQFPDLPKDCFQRMPGLVSDALPDAFGNALIEAYLANRGSRLEAISELDRLAYMGRRGMGALEFEPADGPQEPHNATPIAIKSLVEQARLAISGTLDQSAARHLQELIRVGTSAGGARPKAVIAWNPTTNEIRSGQFNAADGFEQWLLKFDGVGRDLALGNTAEYGRIEYAYYLMAKAAGITMSPCRLLEEGGRAHFMTRRFDRDGATKHHVQTLCGLAHMSYKFPQAYSYNQYFMVIKDSLNLGDSALQEGFRRMAFNVCARNNDDHTKNFSFILPKNGQWQLSPAYDMTYAYNPESVWTRYHMMGVNGKFTDITRQDLLTVAERFLIPDAPKLLNEVNEVVQAWPKFAQEAGLSAERTEFISKNLVPMDAPARRRSIARGARRQSTVAATTAAPLEIEVQQEQQHRQHHHEEQQDPPSISV